MRRIFIILVSVFFTLTAGTALAETVSYDPFDKDYSVSIQGERTFLADSDFKDFWELDASYDGLAVSIERKLRKKFGIELTAGYGHYDSKENDVLSPTDRVILDIKNYHVSATPKLYFRTGERTELYLGAGADYYAVEIDLDYKRGIFSDGYRDKFHVLGLHAQAGGEFVLFRNQAAKGDIDAPVCIFAEYRYSWVNITDADEDFIDEINTALGTSEDSHDLDIGGHTGVIGLRWRF